MAPAVGQHAPRASGTWGRWRWGSSSFFFQAEDGIRDKLVTGVQTCALPILETDAVASPARVHARMLRQHAGHQGDQQIGVRQFDATRLFNRRLQFLLRGDERTRVHFANYEEMRNSGPALSGSLGHEPTDGAQRLEVSA